jgi:hypothetical protein
MSLSYLNPFQRIFIVGKMLTQVLQFSSRPVSLLECSCLLNACQNGLYYAELHFSEKRVCKKGQERELLFLSSPPVLYLDAQVL